MKKSVSLYVVIFLSIISLGYAKPSYDSPIYWNRNPTYESTVKPEEVVVVYNSALAVSDSVKNYYVNKRNIPETNVIGIYLPDNKSGYGATYNSRSGQISGPVYNKSTWNFYQNYIEIPLMNEMKSRTVDGVSLKNKAKYIVVVKGIPQTLNSTGSFNDQYHYNASVDALLCLLFQDFMMLFGTHYRTQFNAYYAVDLSYSFDHHFKSKHYSNGRFHLSYLVSRLDGGAYPNNYETIKQAIDNGITTDKSGKNVFILDDKDTYNRYLDLKGAEEYLTTRKFNTEFNTNSRYLTSHELPVMGYSSHGVHSGLSQDYIINTLQFNYAKGAVFNTAESFNGWSFNEREAKNQGLLADFISKGGTGGIANVHEPYSGSIARTSIFFTAYAMGYSLVEAAYMSIPYLGWVQTVVGDPFTTIAQGKDGIDENTYWDQDMIVTGDVYLKKGSTLTVTKGSTITFKGSSKLIVQSGANLILEEDAVLKTMIEDPEKNQPINFVTGTESELGEINFLELGQTSEVTVQSVVNSEPPNIQTLKYVSRFYNIEVDEGIFDAKIVLPYNESDLKNESINESNLTLMFLPASQISYSTSSFKSQFSVASSSEGWQEMGGELDTTNNTITFDGADEPGLWAIIDPSEDYILPVSLSDFSGAQVESGVKLNWSTSSETDNLGFILLRDGVQIADYNSSNLLKGNGSVSYQNEYSYTDFDVLEGNTYQYTIRSVDYSGEIHDYDFNVDIEINKIEKQASPFNNFSYNLDQNYPNPFNPSTQIAFTLDKASRVRLEVYDLLGRLVKTLINKDLQVGKHEVKFDAQQLASGTYIYRLQSQNRVLTKKMMLIK